MAVSVADQARALLGAIGLGAAAGLMYDLFRVLRVRIPLRWLGPVLDLVFWLCCTITFFLWSVDSVGGLVRIYTAIAALSGAWCYFALLSSHLLPICYRLATIFTKAMGVILLPLTTIRRLGKNISEICKNLFHSRKEWFTIRKKFRKMDCLRSIYRHTSRGGSGIEVQAGRHHHKIRPFDTRGLHGHSAA